MSAKLAWTVLTLALIAGIYLRASHINDRHTLTPNERAYLYDAARVHDEGVGVTRALFAEYKNDPELWAVAQPVRIGYIFLLATAMQLMGTTTLAAGMTLSFLGSVTTLLLVAWLGVRFFNSWVGAIASVLCATAFTEIWLVRGTPEDGVFGLFGLLEIWLTCEIMRSPQRRWLYVPFHLVGMWAILVKQSGVFVYGFPVLFLIWFLWFRERARKQAIILAASVAGGLVVVAAFYVLIAGDAATAWRVYLLSFVSNAEGWSYNEECCFGPWTQLPRVLFALSPLTFVSALAGIAILAISGSLSPLQRRCGAICAIMAIGFVSLFTFFPGMEVLRFITPGQGAVCLVAGLGIWRLLAWAHAGLPKAEFVTVAAFVSTGVLYSMFRDYEVFNKVAISAGIPELGGALIRGALGI